MVSDIPVVVSTTPELATVWEAVKGLPLTPWKTCTIPAPTPLCVRLVYDRVIPKLPLAVVPVNVSLSCITPFSFGNPKYPRISSWFSKPNAKGDS